MTSPTHHGPRYRQLPLWRNATRLVLDVENAVRHFGKTPSPPRYHKYALGSDLRHQAMGVCHRVARAAQCSNATHRHVNIALAPLFHQVNLC